MGQQKYPNWGQTGFLIQIPAKPLKVSSLNHLQSYGSGPTTPLNSERQMFLFCNQFVLLKEARGTYSLSCEV